MTANDVHAFMTASEVAAVFRWSVRKARRRLREGAFPGAWRDGRDWRVPETAVRSYRGATAGTSPLEAAVSELVERFGSASR